MPIRLDEAEINTEEWILFDAEEEREMIDILERAAKKFVNTALKENVSVCFPKEWWPDGDGYSDNDVDDPLTIYIVLDHDEVLKKISLTSALEETIHRCEMDGAFAEGLKEISKAMKDLSSRIDTVIAKHGED